MRMVKLKWYLVGNGSFVRNCYFVVGPTFKNILFLPKYSIFSHLELKISKKVLKSAITAKKVSVNPVKQ